MLDFTFCSPTQFVFGRGAQKQAGRLLKENGATKVLIHYGGGSVKRSGLLDEVRESLREANIPFVELGGAQPNPMDDLVYEGIELCRREGVDFVLALGGGSAIDSGKAIADGVLYAGDFWDFFSGKVVLERSLPVGVVLTIPAAGSESSDSSVITRRDGMRKNGNSSPWHRPRFALMNPELTYTLPWNQTANGICDMMAHIFERYFTRTPDVDLTDEMCEAVLRSIIRAAKDCQKNPESYESRATLMWAGTIAHNNTLGVGRAQDWGTHKIEHELSALYGVAHGAGLAVLFPAWMQYVYQQDVARFARFAHNVMGCADTGDQEKDALAGIAALKAFWGSLELPLSFAELGAKTEDIPKLAATVRYDADGGLGNFMRLREADVVRILEIAAQ
ncbi:iron-containing alcohol dehydrogenase [Eubacteriales bacterium OttesenSCG-928-A19]|nr:iron-containing alcohol dehydrogenase [Eubacteriales bacterium OttesenSCG-928-A19]